MGDKELIEALRQGQNAAWSELVDRYLKLVLHVIRRTIGAPRGGAGEHDVEDVAHEFFGHLCRDDYRALSTIREPYDLKAWLAIGARRRAIDFMRRRRSPLSMDAESSGGSSPAALLAAPATADPESVERQAEVDRALAGLPAKERLVVQLFYLKGLKYREIAKITGISINSISPMLSRAVARIQKIVGVQG